MSKLNEMGHKAKREFASFANRKPVYRLTKAGIEVRYMDFSDYNELPFDRDTYHNCQIFVGDWANPVWLDLESINDAIGDEFTEYDKRIHSIDGEHITPSQKYKTFMKQRTLERLFVSSGFDVKRLEFMIYGILAMLAVIIVMLIGVIV